MVFNSFHEEDVLCYLLYYSVKTYTHTHTHVYTYTYCICCIFFNAIFQCFVENVTSWTSYKWEMNKNNFTIEGFYRVLRFFAAFTLIFLALCFAMCQKIDAKRWWWLRLRQESYSVGSHNVVCMTTDYWDIRYNLCSIPVGFWEILYWPYSLFTSGMEAAPVIVIR